jgi:hypothetical protein
MQHIKLKTINNVIVKQIKKRVEDTKPVRGGEIVPMDVNVCSVSATAGGKTTVTKNILEAIVTKNTKIIAFVSTIFNDDNWIAIREWAAEKEIDFEAHTSIQENGVNILKKYVEHFKEEAKEREKKRLLKQFENIMPKKQIGGYRFDKPVHEEEEEKPKKRKFQDRKYIMIFDDVADETRGIEFTTLLKRARHMKVTVLVNVQDLKDITKASRKQVRVWLLFRYLDEERLRDVYGSIGSPLSFDQFEEVYKFATAEPYNFLYIAPNTQDYRKNFNKQIPLAHAI